jgi:hypothetical protein
MDAVRRDRVESSNGIESGSAYRPAGGIVGNPTEKSIANKSDPRPQRGQGDDIVMFM